MAGAKADIPVQDEGVEGRQGMPDRDSVLAALVADGQSLVHDQLPDLIGLAETVATVARDDPRHPAGLVAALIRVRTLLIDQLRTGNFEAADQTTRDLLIEIAGADATKRGYVYWTEARMLDAAALGAVENLWLHYSDGKFGYTVQKDVWRRQKGVFDRFCDKIGWTTEDDATGQARKRRWFGQSEFFYTLQEAPKGHLPLTSALRGTQLLKALLQHPLWETDGWKRDL